MNLKIKFNGYALVVPCSDASVVINAFEQGQMYSCNWNGELTKETESKIEFSFIRDEDLVPPTDVITELKKEKDLSDKRWIDYYNKFTESEKKVKELQDKLNSITGVVNSATEEVF